MTLRTFRLTEEPAHHSSSVFKDHLFLNNDVIQIVGDSLLRFFRPFFKRNLKKITRNIKGHLPKIYNLCSCRQLMLDSFGDGHGRCCNKIKKWWIALSSISSLNFKHIFFATEHAPSTLLSCTRKCKLVSTSSSTLYLELS